MESAAMFLNDLHLSATGFCHCMLEQHARCVSPTIYTAGREYLQGDENRWNQVSERYANPHQGTSAFLILEWRESENSSCRYIARIDDAITECKKCGKNVAGQGGEKKIQGHGPLRWLRVTRPVTDNWPPEYQNRRPADRKDVSSTMCQVCDDMARLNSVGICQAITAAAPASQQKTELLRKHPSNGGILLLTSRLLRIKYFGSPRCSGKLGAPNKINGAPAVVKRRCFIMWTVSNWWSSAASGEPRAIHSENSPLTNPASRQNGSRVGKALRIRSQPWQ